MQYIIEHNSGSIAVLDQELRYIFVSKGFLKTHNLNDQDVVGKHHWDVITDVPLKWRDVHLRALSGEEVNCDEDSFERSDGALEWTRWNCRPWYNEQGRIGGVILNFELITEKKKTQEALSLKDQMYQSLFHSNQVSILLWNSENFNIVDANPAACKYYEWTHDQIVTKKISDINILSDAEILAETEKSIAEGCNHFHFKHRLANNEIRNVEVYSGMIAVEQSNLIYSLIFDVTERDKFQQELHETQERNEALLKANPDVMFVLNKEGVLLDYHSGENGSFSVAPSFYLNKKIGEVFPPDLTELVLSRLIDLLATSQIQTFNYQWKIGNEIKYSIARLVMIGKDKALIIGSDITDRELANERIKLQASAMDAAIDGLSINDEEGKFIYVNKAYADMFGYDSSALIGQSWRILYDSDELDRFDREIYPLLMSKGKFYLRAVGKKKDGSTFPQSISVTKLENGRIISAVHDISIRIKAEQELIDARIRAEESDRLKSSFLANMSHEIRTPMNGIIGFAGLLKEPKLSGEEREDYLNIIVQSGERLLNIINDIVEISKIEAGMIEMKIVRTNINDQLDYIGKFFKPEIEKKGMQLMVKTDLQLCDAVLETDKEKLYAVLINLVKNAIKYSHQGTIEIGCMKRNNCLEFHVKDNGIGIPENMQKFIFNRFIQVEKGNKRAYEGNGLGLAISKAYVEMLGGKIWLRSQPGKGSIFSFTIPFENKPHVHEKEENIEQVDFILNDLKVLIVEDEPLSKKLLTKLMEPFSCQILYAGTGREAVKICWNNPGLHFILMDIQMPDMDGYEAARAIRHFNQEVVIIAQTAFALSHNREEALLAGCTDYISKPIKKDILTGLIEKYFGNAKLNTNNTLQNYEI